jgi:hypothetical protein
MRLHSPRCTNACDLRAPTMRPSPSRANAWVRPPAYIANAHVMYNIYISIDIKSGYVNGYACAFLHTRTGIVSVCTMHAFNSIHARLATPMNGSPMRARRTDVFTCCVHAHARVCVCDWAPTHPRRTVRSRSAGVDRGWLGLQAFYQARTFNANIGTWNTASVTSLYYVCAALSGPGGAPPLAGRARRVVDAARAVVRGGTADARARVCVQTCGHANARGCTCAGIAACSRDGIYAMVVMYVCMFVCIF